MKLTSENTTKKQQKGFVKGISGNPDGRPKGALNHTTKLAQQLLEGEAENITRKVVELALAGDIQASKLVIERLIPIRKELPIDISVTDMRTSEDVSITNQIIFKAVSKGDLTLSEGYKLMEMSEHIRSSIEMLELDRRLTNLEKIAKERSQ